MAGLGAQGLLAAANSTCKLNRESSAQDHMACLNSGLVWSGVLLGRPEAGLISFDRPHQSRHGEGWVGGMGCSLGMLRNGKGTLIGNEQVGTRANAKGGRKMGMNFRNVDCGEKPKGNGGVKRLAHREQTSSLRMEARKLARNLEN